MFSGKLPILLLEECFGDQLGLIKGGIDMKVCKFVFKENKDSSIGIWRLMASEAETIIKNVEVHGSNFRKEFKYISGIDANEVILEIKFLDEANTLV